MSSSSPSDLAIAFRSIPRRLREARGDASGDAVLGINRELDEQLELAARLMRAPSDPDKLADAIQDVPADAWDKDTLNSLRAIALDIGRLLRAMAAVTDGDDDR